MAEKYYSQMKDVRLPSENYILVLPGWYPNWQDAATGDFNQRQVMAAGIQTPQIVLYIAKDQTQKLRSIKTKYNQLTENVIEITVMYPAKINKWVDAVYSNLMYLRLLYTYAGIIKRRWGKPVLIHSYIVIRGGLGGMLLSKKFKIPFILSEHWTIYYPEDPGYLYKRNPLFKWLVKMVFKNLTCFLPVTYNLQQQVYKLLKTVPSAVVPNVADTTIFYYSEMFLKEKSFRFVHVSTMVYQKNSRGILRAFKKFRQLSLHSSLWMVGPYPQDISEYAKSIGLDDNAVHFTGSVPYAQVGEILRRSHVFVLFSRYENLPCVILEALCCGLPVISTNVGGISEVINDSNGILLNGENEEHLTAAFSKMFSEYKNYNQKLISDTASALYSYNAVGSLINAVYTKIKKTF